MSSYDPNQTSPLPSWTPPTNPSPLAPLTETQPTAEGDRWGIAAMAVVFTTLISCIPGLNCLAPFVPLVVGIITLTKARNAVDPNKARLYGWLATGLGIITILGIIILIVLYGALISQVMNNPEFQFAP